MSSSLLANAAPAGGRESYMASQSWDDVFEDESERRRPYRKVALAAFLCLLGTALLATGLGLWYNGHAERGYSEWRTRMLACALGVLRMAAHARISRAAMHADMPPCI